jgi:hypothetical protein
VSNVLDRAVYPTQPAAHRVVVSDPRLQLLIYAHTIKIHSIVNFTCVANRRLFVNFTCVDNRRLFVNFTCVVNRRLFVNFTCVANRRLFVNFTCVANRTGPLKRCGPLPEKF